MTGTRARAELISTEHDVVELAQQLRFDPVLHVGWFRPSNMSAADLMANCSLAICASTGPSCTTRQTHHRRVGSPWMGHPGNEGLDLRTDHLAVRIMPTSVTPGYLMGEARIAAADIAAATGRSSPTSN